MQIKFDDECLLAVKHSAKCFTDMYCLNVFVYFLIRETGERERGRRGPFRAEETESWVRWVKYRFQAELGHKRLPSVGTAICPSSGANFLVSATSALAHPLAMCMVSGPRCLMVDYVLLAGDS